MRKISKNKMGFTLIEMVLVIAIIVILAAVLVMNISTYLNKAKGATSSILSHNNAIQSGLDIIDANT